MSHVFNSAIAAFFQLIHVVLDVYLWIVVATAVLTWLTAFKVVDRENDGVKRVSELLGKLTEPFLRPIRRALKPMGDFDPAPLVLLLIVFFLQSFVSHMDTHYLVQYNTSPGMPFYGDGTYR